MSQPKRTLRFYVALMVGIATLPAPVVAQDSVLSDADLSALRNYLRGEALVRPSAEATSPQIEPTQPVPRVPRQAELELMPPTADTVPSGATKPSQRATQTNTETPLSETMNEPNDTMGLRESIGSVSERKESVDEALEALNMQRLKSVQAIDALLNRYAQNK